MTKNTDKLSHFYFTFKENAGGLFWHYVRIDAPSKEAAIQRMNNIFTNCWDTCYTSVEWHKEMSNDVMSKPEIGVLCLMHMIYCEEEDVWIVKDRWSRGHSLLHSSDLVINVREFCHDTGCFYAEVSATKIDGCVGTMQLRISRRTNDEDEDEPYVICQETTRPNPNGTDSKIRTFHDIDSALKFISEGGALDGRRDPVDTNSVVWVMPNLEKYDALELPSIVSSSLSAYTEAFEELICALVCSCNQVLEPATILAVRGEPKQ